MPAGTPRAVAPAPPAGRPGRRSRSGRSRRLDRSGGCAVGRTWLAAAMYLRPAVWAQSTASASGWLERTLASLTSIGRLTPAITSTPWRSICEMARLLGVPPNMSVSSTTPSPVSTVLMQRWISVAAPLDVVIGADADRCHVPLGAHDVFHGRPQFLCEPAMSDQYKTDHGKMSGLLCLDGWVRRRCRRGCHRAPGVARAKPPRGAVHGVSVVTRQPVWVRWDASCSTM